MTVEEFEDRLTDYVLQEKNREAVDVDHEQTFTGDAGDEIHVATVTVSTGNEYWAVGGDTAFSLYRYAELEDADAVLQAHAESLDESEDTGSSFPGP